MRVTNLRYEHQTGLDVHISGKPFKRGWKVRHQNPNINWTRERNIAKINQGAKKFLDIKKRHASEMVWNVGHPYGCGKT